MKRKFQFLIYLLFLSGSLMSGSAFGSTLLQQTWLPGDLIFPTIGFTQPLPVFGPGYNAAFPRVNALKNPFIKVTNPANGPGYVWHCHILDHEDNEMMRPYKV